MQVWKDIRDYEGLYQISNLGNVKRSKRESTGRLLNPYVNSHGYLTVSLSKNGDVSREIVHRLVAKAFIKQPLGQNVVNHLDGNPLNNRVDNLEWCTQKQNIIHAIENELIIHRIKTIDRETMLDLLNNNFNYDEIAGILGVAKGTVFNYIRKFKIKKIYV